MRAIPTIAVIGAGPAGLTAVRQLRDQGGVHVVLVVPEGQSEYLAGTLAVATGDARAAQYRTRVELAGVEIIAAQVDAIEPGALRIGGSWLRAHAVIAAPGLALDPVGRATRGEIVGFRAPTGAEAAAPRIRAVERGVIDVMISSLPYRCPPAPYGLAMRLARRARRLDQPLQVPGPHTSEPTPLPECPGDVGGQGPDTRLPRRAPWGAALLPAESRRRVEGCGRSAPSQR
jgi:sulfide:quinone oxidoreductase